jgi:hypothetical protein
MKKNDPTNVVPLFGESRDLLLPEMKIETVKAVSKLLPTAEAGKAIDLTGWPKLFMAVGRGRVGKTTLLRWAVERAMANEGADPPILFSVSGAPRLANFFPDVYSPPVGDTRQSVAWLERRIARLVEIKRTAVIDFGGGDTALSTMAAEHDLAAWLQEAGVMPVVFYMLGADQFDLSPLKTMEEIGFQPKATALVLNCGIEDGDDYEQVFAQVRHHSVYRAAIDRGAQEVWMPKLFAAADVENRNIGFRESMNWAGGKSPTDGRNIGPIDMFARRRVHRWLELMDSSFDSLKSWLP